MHMKTLAALAATTALALGATACGGADERHSEHAGHAPTSRRPSRTPVAEIPALTGKDTAVTLDAGFVKALGTLKLTPAPVGNAEISKAGVAVLPDHRRQRHLLQARHRVPVRAGHDRP